VDNYTCTSCAAWQGETGWLMTTEMHVSNPHPRLGCQISAGAYEIKFSDRHRVISKASTIWSCNVSYIMWCINPLKNEGQLCRMLGHPVGSDAYHMNLLLGWRTVY